MNTISNLENVREQLKDVNEKLLSNPICEILMKQSLELTAEYKRLLNVRAIELKPEGTTIVMYFNKEHKYVYYRECDDVYGVEMFHQDRNEWTGTDWKSYNLTDSNVNFTIARELIWQK